MSERRSVLAHRERSSAVYQTDWQIRRRIVQLFAALGVLVLLHVLAMMSLEGLTFRQALWLTLTTLMTVGYGDHAARTPLGQTATVLLMYVSSITLLTLIVSDYIEYRFFRKERIRSGRWRWNMVSHIVVINSPRHGSEQYFVRLLTQLRVMPDMADIPVELLTTRFPEGLPASLQELGVVHYHGSAQSVTDLKMVNIQRAKHIIVLAPDETDPISDSLNFDTIYRLKEMKLTERVVAECILDENRARLRQLGVPTILRPVRTYPEIMICAITAPGTEKVLEDMFTYENDHPHRYDLPLSGLNWAETVSALVREDLGTALAFIDPSGNVIVQPKALEEVRGKALIMLVKTDRTPTLEQITKALSNHRERLAKWEEARRKLEREYGESFD